MKIGKRQMKNINMRIQTRAKQKRLKPTPPLILSQPKVHMPSELKTLEESTNSRCPCTSVPTKLNQTTKPTPVQDAFGGMFSRMGNYTTQYYEPINRIAGPEIGGSLSTIDSKGGGEKEQLNSRFNYKDRDGKPKEMRFIDPKQDPFAKKETYGIPTPVMKKSSKNDKKPEKPQSDRQKELRQTRDTNNLIKGLSYRTNPRRPSPKSSAFLSTTRGLSTLPFVEEEEKSGAGVLPLRQKTVTKRTLSQNPGTEVGRYNPRFDLVHQRTAQDISIIGHKPDTLDEAISRKKHNDEEKQKVCTRLFSAMSTVNPMKELHKKTVAHQQKVQALSMKEKGLREKRMMQNVQAGVQNRIVDKLKSKYARETTTRNNDYGGYMRRDSQVRTATQLSRMLSKIEDAENSSGSESEQQILVPKQLHRSQTFQKNGKDMYVNNLEVIREQNGDFPAQVAKSIFGMKKNIISPDEHLLKKVKKSPKKIQIKPHVRRVLDEKYAITEDDQKQLAELLNTPIGDLSVTQKKLAGSFRTKFVESIFSSRKDDQRDANRVEQLNLSNEKNKLNEISDFMEESKKLANKQVMIDESIRVKSRAQTAMTYNSSGQKVVRDDSNQAAAAIAEIKKAIIFLQMESEHKRTTDKGYKFNMDAFQKDTKNLGRTKDEETGKYHYQNFSYPTYYCTDTHHLMLSKKDSKSDFVVLPNKMTSPMQISQNSSSVFLGAERTLSLPTRRTVSQHGFNKAEHQRNLDYNPVEDRPRSRAYTPALMVKPQLTTPNNQDIMPKFDRSTGECSRKSQLIQGQGKKMTVVSYNSNLENFQPSSVNIVKSIQKKRQNNRNQANVSLISEKHARANFELGSHTTNHDSRPQTRQESVTNYDHYLLQSDQAKNGVDFGKGRKRPNDVFNVLKSNQTSSLLGTYNLTPPFKPPCGVLNMNKQSSALDRNKHYKRLQISMAETVVQIDGLKTISKSLTPGYMLKQDKREENKRVLNQTADWGKQISRKNMGLLNQSQVCSLSMQEEEQRALRESQVRERKEQRWAFRFSQIDPTGQYR